MSQISLKPILKTSYVEAGFNTYGLHVYDLFIATFCAFQSPTKLSWNLADKNC